MLFFCDRREGRLTFLHVAELLSSAHIFSFPRCNKDARTYLTSFLCAFKGGFGYKLVKFGLAVLNVCVTLTFKCQPRCRLSKRLISIIYSSGK